MKERDNANAICVGMIIVPLLIFIVWEIYVEIGIIGIVWFLVVIVFLIIFFLIYILDKIRNYPYGDKK